MAKTIQAVFDGEVLRPEQPVDLQPNTTYEVTIEREMPAQGEGTEETYLLTEIGRLAVEMGVANLAARHEMKVWLPRAVRLPLLSQVQPTPPSPVSRSALSYSYYQVCSAGTPPGAS